MGRHRYYCDYCEKMFIDDIDARKKHLNSAHHIKMKKLHYDQYRDVREVFADEILKTPCRRFHQTGFCSFDTSCKYTHYTQEQLWEMKQSITLQQQKHLHKQYAHCSQPQSVIDEWIQKVKTKPEEELIADDGEEFWDYPAEFENRDDLPPSLKKFEPEDFTDSNFAEWGSFTQVLHTHNTYCKKQN